MPPEEPEPVRPQRPTMHVIENKRNHETNGPIPENCSADANNAGSDPRFSEEVNFPIYYINMGMQ